MCVRAMRGRDAETRRALWRAALRFNSRDAGAGEKAPASLPRLGLGSPCVGGE
jgi:hypothetical protein